MFPGLSELPVHQQINAGSAAMNREMFQRNGVIAISIFGGPGCGKTSLLEVTLRHLRNRLRIGVIVGNVRADEDVERLRHWSSPVIGIEAIDLDAALVREALLRIDLSPLDLLLIERAAAAPPEPQDLGQAATVGMFSVSGGHDKVDRYPERVCGTNLVLLTKADLLPFVPFDATAFRASVNRLNQQAQVLEISAVNGFGLGEWFGWITSQLREPPEAALANKGFPSSRTTDYFVG
ncbi:MAG TPA: hydrogenase nickel incorporation protein HypB [Tepidisphaeraceae bacterium]